MTNVFITVDTEYSSRDVGLGREANFEQSILGRTRAGTFGLPYKLDVLDRHGLKGVFFVDPMPALVWGVEAIADVTRMILERGHDVQLHVHVEWLAHAGAANPLGGKTGRNLKELSLEDQRTVLSLANELLIEAGVPPPVAFRAGNYGANDDTLRALADLGLACDTSFCPGIARSDCAIGLPADQIEPISYCGVTEIPIGAIAGFGGSRRHAQVTALSAAEMVAAVRHARDAGHTCFTLVSHSFELLSRDRRWVNPIVRRRFETFCAELARLDGVRTATYRDDASVLAAGARVGMPKKLLPHNPFRTGWRMAEQVLSNRLYGALSLASADMADVVPIGVAVSGLALP